ncbi:hypothetical protein JYG34_15195 [Pseudomonas entomophila]|uniref:hypothetical protein n=1 Tax=Pseudomonas entomophila TaxID=312306 RepID=UPI001BD0CF87|nr:hypothetical protein [Pseudomonas entomophila]QVM89377.1 hypothetical protein JYG34_15195 [Pseudomonas entomophila]
MKHLHKLVQQRRRQLHVHMSPSGLQSPPDEGWAMSARSAPAPEGRKVMDSKRAREALDLGLNNVANLHAAPASTRQVKGTAAVQT